MRKSLLILCLLAAPAFIGSAGITELFRPAPVDWASYLPAIAWVESRNRQFAVSYLGAYYGRGRHMVSEVAFEHWKWKHWDSWVVKMGLGPDCLFNDDINSMVALWLLEWLDRYYEGRLNHRALVLSAYYQGQHTTDERGVAWDYVGQVLSKL